ncbi:hypothetical protein H4582DRAFT_2095296 [Lactarius indigo]|nr:hypothetical protein H4582DRAFT_2095296 [Lactarius indigo]
MSNPPRFPQPFASAETTYPTQNATNTHEQFTVVPAQGSVYPSESHIPRGAPNHIPPTNAPSRYPSQAAHPPTYQPTQVPFNPPPTFPMPQLSTTPSGLPQHTAQWNETDRLNNDQLPPAYPNSPLQAPIVSHSHSHSQLGSGMVGGPHNVSRAWKNPDGSEESRYAVGQSTPATSNGSLLLSKSPPTPSCATVPSADAGGLVLKDSNIVVQRVLIRGADVQSGIIEDPQIEVRR